MVHIELRLEVVEQRLFFKCITYLALKLQRALSFQELRRKAQDVVAAVGALDLVHRSIGIRTKGVLGSRIMRELRIPEAGSDVEVGVVYRNAVMQHIFILLDGIEDIFFPLIITDDQNKLVSADAGNKIERTRNAVIRDILPA